MHYFLLWLVILAISMFLPLSSGLLVLLLCVTDGQATAIRLSSKVTQALAAIRKGVAAYNNSPAPTQSHLPANLTMDSVGDPNGLAFAVLHSDQSV